MPTNSPLRGCRALRKGRVSIPAQAYLITVVCHDREAIFYNARLARVATAVLELRSKWPHATVSAWVLLPDHWHAQIVLSGDETLGRVVQRVKGRVTRQLRLTTESEKPIWQRGFHDHALRREESMVTAARYLLDNPVRAGLVEHWNQWPHRGGDWLATLDPTNPLL